MASRYKNYTSPLDEKIANEKWKTRIETIQYIQTFGIAFVFFHQIGVPTTFSLAGGVLAAVVAKTVALTIMV